jgi:hypothetical protein
MSYIGDFPEDHATVSIMFTTHAASGAAVAPSSGFEAADVLIYKNGSATQKTTTNGMTMTSPFDSITGLHCLVIDTSVDTGDVGFWTAGAHYTAVLSPDETVDSLVVVKVIATFSLALAPIFARVGAPAGASLSADVAAVKTDTAAVKTKTDSLTFTVGGMVDSNVVDWKGATAPAMTGDAYSRLGAPAGASVSADVAAVKVDTAAIKVQTDKVTFTVANQVDVNVLDWKGATAPAMTGDAFARIGAAGAGLTALGDTRIAHLDADITSRMATFSYTAPLDAAGTRTAVGMASANLDTQLSTIAGYIDTEVAAIKAKTDNLPSDPADASDIAAAFTALQSHGDGAWLTATGFATAASLATTDGKVDGVKTVTDKLDDTVEDDAGTFRFTANALEQAPTGGSAPSASDIADEVQTRTIAAVTLVNGLAANSVTAAALAADAVTEIQTGLATASALSTLATNVDDLPTNAELAAGFAAADDAALAAIATLSSGISASFTVLSAHGDSTWSTATGFATPTNVSDGTTTVTDAIAALTVPSAADNAAALLAATYEGAETVQDHFRLARAALYGKANGLDGTTVHFRDAADSKNRITAIVTSDGDRTSVTTDAT